MRRAAAVLVVGVACLAAACAAVPAQAPSPSPPEAGNGQARARRAPVVPAPAVSLRPVGTPEDQDYRLAARDQVTVTAYGQKDLATQRPGRPATGYVRARR